MSPARLVLTLNVRQPPIFPMTDPVVLHLTKRVEDLEARVSWLESELRISREINVMAVLRHRWGLSPNEARVLDILYHRRGRYTARGLIIDMGWPDFDDQPTDKNIDVHVCRIRKKLKNPHAILTEPFVGYRIGDQLAEEIGRMKP